jgi:hypothetical protein
MFFQPSVREQDVVRYDALNGCAAEGDEGGKRRGAAQGAGHRANLKLSLNLGSKLRQISYVPAHPHVAR